MEYHPRILSVFRVVEKRPGNIAALHEIEKSMHAAPIVQKNDAKFYYLFYYATNLWICQNHIPSYSALRGCFMWNLCPVAGLLLEISCLRD